MSNAVPYLQVVDASSKKKRPFTERALTSKGRTSPKPKFDAALPKWKRAHAGLVQYYPAQQYNITFYFMPRQAPSCKDWCFTINNPRRKHGNVDSDWDRVKSWIYNYLVMQLEVGEEGTPHIQGFVQFPVQSRLTKLKKLCKRAHWEPRRGSAYQAAHYCKKPEPHCDCEHCEAAKDVPRPQLIFESGTISAPAGEKLHSVAMSLKRHGLSKTIESYPTHYMGMTRGMVNRQAIN